MNYLEAMTNSAADSATMTSIEIAELTEKQHGHIIRDIKSMMASINPNMDALDYKGVFVDRREDNGQIKAIRLSKDLTITLVSGYSVVMRHRIITRWQELEAEQKAPAPRELTRPFTLQDGLFAQHPQTPSDTTLFTHEGVQMAYSPSTGIAYRQLPNSKRWNLITPGTLYKIYTQVSINGKNQQLHRMIAQHFLNNGEPLSKAQHIDHREHADGSQAQDRLTNLRIVTPNENHQNRKNTSSKFAGVSWHKTRSKWRSQIQLHGKVKHLGWFTLEHEAAKAYIQACQANGMPCKVAIERFAANRIVGVAA